MDTEESGVRNSICSEDAASNTSNYSSPGKVSRMSSSFDEQSDSSGESDDNEADADIDQMLTELEDFQVELVQTESQHAIDEELPEKNEPLDEISFSMNAIEDSGDVDLDALLEDLCIMEKDLTSGRNNDNHSVERSPSPSKLASRRLSSPVKVTADVKEQLIILEEELENQKELSFEEQQAKFKEEKIRIAMEKLREARVKKLVIKVFNDKDPTSKTILIDQTWTAWQVCLKMMKKDDEETSANWVLEERQPENQLDRVLEDHECIVDIVSQWPRDTSNQLVFTMRRDKYVLFKNPQNYLLSSDTAEGSARLAEQSKDTLISEFFKPDAMRLPNLSGVLYLKEGKRSWKKHYFLLRASGIYYTPKGKTKDQRNMSCLASFENTYVYTTHDFKRTLKAPFDHCFVIKPSVVKDLESRQVKCLCAPDAQTMQRWVTCIRVGKFGYKMLENKNKVQEEVEDLTVGNIKRSRTMSNDSGSSNDAGSHGTSHQESGIRSRTRSDTGELAQKRSQTLKKQPERNAKTIGKLFQDAWKKGGAAEQMSSSPTSPATPFSPPRSAQTPSAAGSKSFFVENERLRNLDKINEESVNTHVAPDSSIVLDPAPPPRKSFSNESNHKRVDSGNNSLPDLPLPSPPPPVLPKQIIPSPDLPPPPPPVLPKVLRTNSTTSEQSDSSIKGDEYVPSPPPPVLPKRTSVDGSIRNGLTTSDGCSNDRYSLPCHSSRSESQTSSHELPLPPPPVSPKSSLYSTGDFRLGEPELHFPPPPSYSPGISVIDTKETQSTPTAFPSPPPPPPRTFQSAEMSTRM